MGTGESKRWRGLLVNELAEVQRAVMLVLCVLAATIPPGSLGIYPAAETHILISLIPVALAALLFGKERGCIIGALAGLAEMLHAIFQPYDYYEKLFSSPINSIVLFALFGLIMGMLFACIFKHNPAKDASSSRTSRLLCLIVAACAAGSIFFTAFLQCSIYIGGSVFVSNIPTGLVRQTFSTTGIIEQICFHLLLVGLPCTITGVAVERFSMTKRKMSVRTKFQLWLGALTVAFFFVASGAAYTAVTHMSVVNMNAALSDQLDALASELVQRDTIVNTLDERGVMPRDNLGTFAQQQYRNINCDLAGWSKDTTVLSTDGTIFASNREDLVGHQLADVVTAGLGDTTLADAFASETAVEYYQGQGYEISYLHAIKTSYEHLGKSGEYQLVTIVPSSETFLNRALYMYLVAAVFAFMLGTIFIVLMRLLNRVVAKTVDSTNEALSRITAGELDQRVPDSNTAEFSSLAAGINTTVSALEESIAEANARIDRELAAARAIQEGALPATQPPFPNIDAFDLYATMDPAREVGGDFYDFFDLGERGIGFVVADVSGKGMPAALFMMAAKTAIHGAMEAKAGLADAIGIANRSLCKGNDSEMFVTAFAGILDYRTGKLTYVNAGHNKPLVLHGDTWTWLKERSGPYLGSFDWVEYKQFEIQLQKEDELFVYTDGVNEAFDANEECYGNERLEAFLAAHAELHPRRLLRALRAELIGWAVGAEQSDDITMLALKYGIPPEHGASLLTTADLGNFEQIEEFVTRMLDEAECPRKAASHILVAVEELVVNVCSYAYPDAAPDKPGPLRIHVTHRTSPDEIVIEVGDDGVPFSPLAHEDPSRPASIEDARIGGLGLVMTKKLMDDVEYVREGIANVTIITKRWE